MRPKDRNLSLARRRTLVLGVAFVTTAAVMLLPPIAAAKSGAPPEPPPLTPKRLHSCGDLIVPSHPWQEFTDGQESAYGEHWGVERWDDKGQNQGSCDFAVDKASDLIDYGYQGTPPLQWGTCGVTRTDTEGVVIEPFYFLDCAVLQHVKVHGRKRVKLWYFEAVANADPAFVTLVSPPGG